MYAHRYQMATNGCGAGGSRDAVHRASGDRGAVSRHVEIGDNDELGEFFVARNGMTTSSRRTNPTLATATAVARQPDHH